MPTHRESRRLRYTPEQLFDLVADVGHYAEFLPWVIAARVTARSADALTADMVVGFQLLREKFTSQVRLERPDAIHVEYVDGPLKYLRNEWRFTAAEGGGTTIDFLVEFEFRNKMFERIAGTVFNEAFRTMVGAFEKRAARLYSAGTQSSPSPTGISSSKAQITA